MNYSNSNCPSDHSSVSSILAVLNQAELSGVQIILAVEHLTDGKIKLNFGTVFPILRRLERKGLVSCRWATPAIFGGDRRKYYQLTFDGKSEFCRLCGKQSIR